MTASPPTTADACATPGCEKERAVVGTDPFTVTMLHCLDCATERDEAEPNQDREEFERRFERSARRLRQDLGPRLSRYRLETFPAGRSEARDAAVEWLHRYQGGARANLYLHGPAGEGKTGLAASLGLALVGLADDSRRVPTVRFFVGRDWLDVVRRASLGDDRGDEIEDAARGADVLILDDLGTERVTPFARERLLSLIDHRYRFELPTVVTSNISPGELVAEFEKEGAEVGTRIASRLVEDAIRVPFSYGNLRLEKRAA